MKSSITLRDPSLLICVAVFLLFHSLSFNVPSASAQEGAVSGQVLGRAASRDFGIMEFRDEFSAVLAHLVEEYWDDSGDWRGDLQGDATCFAPMILYALWKDTDDPALRFMADRTVEHEVSLVTRFLVFPVPHMDLVIGFPCIAERYRATHEEEYLRLFRLGVTSGSLLAEYVPDFFAPYMYDRASTYGAMGTMCFTAYTLSGDPFYRDRGLSLLSVADRECWQEGRGLYAYARNVDWPQATMIMSLAAAFLSGNDSAYRHRCDRIMETLDSRFLDARRGGYFGHQSMSRKGLSGNNALAWAMLDLFEATGDEKYLRKAFEILRWILSEDLYDSRARIIHHHWDTVSGRSEDLCTGCNFHTLCIIYRYNRLAHADRKGPTP